MPTREQYEAAIAMAEREGNIAARDALIRRAGAEMTGTGSFMEKLGAGVQDIVLGAKQLVGQGDPEAIKEHNRIAEQATGGTLGGNLVRALPLATAAFLPGGQSVAGAAGYGALSGLLAPTEDENVAGGKVLNAAMGGAGAGLLQKGANVLIPAAGRVLKSAAQKGREFLPGGSRVAAERAFVETIPQAERAAAEQALSGAVAARQQPLATGVSGAPITSAVATRNPALLAAEREAREAGGALGDPFRNLDEQAAQARWQHLEQNVGGDLQALKQTKDDVYENFLLNAKMRQPFDPKGKLWDEIQDAAQREHNPALKAELERIRDHYMSAYNAGDFKSLHAVRMEAFDDVLTRLSQSDKKAANSLRSKITEFKNIFDKEMERALGPGGKWAAFRREYAEAADALKQAATGEEFLTTARTWNETPGGVPQLTGKRQQMANLATKTDDVFDKPVVSPQASDALQTVRREITEARLPYELGPRGSATAQNLNPTSRVLARAIEAQKRGSAPLTIGAVLAGTGEPMTGAAIYGGTKLLDRRAIAIAEQLINLHTDPARAAQVLAQSNLPPQVKQAVMQQLAQMASRPIPQLGGAMATQTMNQEQ